MNKLFESYIKDRGYTIKPRFLKTFEVFVTTDMHMENIAKLQKMSISGLTLRFNRIYKATGINSRKDLMADYIAFLEDYIEEGRERE